MSSDVLRRLARGVLFPGVEAAWGLGLGLAGRAMGTGEQALWRAPGGGQRVVVVAPHPDDETIGAGGAAALHARGGDAVTVVVVTDGGGSRAGGLPRQEMILRRSAEAREAADVLGVRRLECLGLPEGRWAGGDLRQRLAAAVAGADVVYAPSCVDFHPEHLRVARALAGLLEPRAVVRVYEIGVPLTPLLANRALDVGEVAGQKERALAAYRTQVESIRAVRRLARYRARYHGAREVELFWELSPAAYAAVVRAGDWLAGRCPYRGIRPRPLTDPLVALAGLRARSALRGVAAAHHA